VAVPAGAALVWIALAQPALYREFASLTGLRSAAAASIR
jgi:hypothetical protein